MCDFDVMFNEVFFGFCDYKNVFVVEYEFKDVVNFMIIIV